MRIERDNSAKEDRNAKHHRVELTRGFQWGLKHGSDADSAE